jgi:hypothetical protein
MSNVAHKFPPEEPPTAPIENAPGSTLIRVARIEAHAERATAALMATEDAETLSDVFADLSAIRSLCKRGAPMSGPNEATTKNPTLEQMRAALPLLMLPSDREVEIEKLVGRVPATASRLAPGALAGIHEAAFAGPPAGLRYPAELRDLCSFIHGFSADSCEGAELRMLAMFFGYTTYTTDELDGRFPFMGAATIDLVRAVATYFLRREAFWLAMGNVVQDEQRQGSVAP